MANRRRLGPACKPREDSQAPSRSWDAGSGRSLAQLRRLIRNDQRLRNADRRQRGQDDERKNDEIANVDRDGAVENLADVQRAKRESGGFDGHGGAGS